MRWRRTEETALLAVDTHLRRKAAKDEDTRWSQRHTIAREYISNAPSPNVPEIRKFQLLTTRWTDSLATVWSRAKKLRQVANDRGANQFRRRFSCFRSQMPKVSSWREGQGNLRLIHERMLKGGESGQPH